LPKRAINFSYILAKIVELGLQAFNAFRYRVGLSRLKYPHHKCDWKRANLGYYLIFHRQLSKFGKAISYRIWPCKA